MRFFYEHVTGRPFIISNPVGRESHHIIVCKALTKVFNLEINREIINLPPGSGKSTMMCLFIAWCWTHYPDSNFLYISYAQSLAAKHTAFIKQIVSSDMYKYLFDVEISHESRAKDSFKTTAGGAIKAFGSGGPVTGQDAGLPGLDRFSGCAIMDDAHKPDEAHSETIRKGVLSNYDETIRQRCRGHNVAIVYMGQRVHEDDLTAKLLSGDDVDEWHPTILLSLDSANNAMYPEMISKEKLLALQEKSPYVFASQYQQNPIPPGGSLFKENWFVTLDFEPKVLTTFIVGDTAETSKSYNDATVFSFFGLYEIESYGKPTGMQGLHWIDCLETRIEPKDLKETFLDFWAHCMKYTVPPHAVIIEKKSTGGTLLSLIDELRGARVIDMPRNSSSGNKTKRFLDAQPYVAERRISFTEGARHKKLCIEHMSKITANETHRWDDIADTLSDGIKIALIDKSIYSMASYNDKNDKVLQHMSENLRKRISSGASKYGNGIKGNFR